MSAKPKAPKNPKHGALVNRIVAATLATAGLTAVPLDAAPVPVAIHSTTAPLIHLRDYQRPVFEDKITKVVLLEWSRQIGKSHTLANWAADRALQQLAKMLRGELGDKRDWLIVVISNSKANGAEFGVKVAAIMDTLRSAESQLDHRGYADSDAIVDDELQGLEIRDCAHRIEIKSGGCRARILVLAASPRTARGFSGDLILDEFAFHENASAIWEAAEPIIRANPLFLCRIASTHNGPKTLFNKWVQTKFFPVVSIPLSKAWAMSRHDPKAPLILISLRTRDENGQPVEVTPDQARAESDNLKAYDQNYELKPSAEAGSLLTWELIGKARRAPQFQPCEGEWNSVAIAEIYRSEGDLWLGQDVGRNKDRSVVLVFADTGTAMRCVGILRFKPQTDYVTQADIMAPLMDACRGRIKGYAIDRTGTGQGLVDILHRRYGSVIRGINFSETVPEEHVAPGRKAKTIPVTEVMANCVLRRFLDGTVEIPADVELEESLHKPERIVTEAGKVLIAAERTKNEDGSVDHADHFWAAGLAFHNKESGGAGTFTVQSAGQVELGGGTIFAAATEPLKWGKRLAACITDFLAGGSRGDIRTGGTPSYFVLGNLFRPFRGGNQAPESRSGAKRHFRGVDGQCPGVLNFC